MPKYKERLFSISKYEWSLYSRTQDIVVRARETPDQTTELHAWQSAQKHNIGSRLNKIVGLTPRLLLCSMYTVP